MARRREARRRLQHRAVSRGRDRRQRGCGSGGGDNAGRRAARAGNGAVTAPRRGPGGVRPESTTAAGAAGAARVPNQVLTQEAYNIASHPKESPEVRGPGAESAPVRGGTGPDGAGPESATMPVHIDEFRVRTHNQDFPNGVQKTQTR
jgi:hypothetical protein